MDNLQQERRQRGEDFQDEIRRSWRLIPNLWRRRIRDGRGGTQPADEIILTENGNILAEHKRTKGTKFELSLLRVNQVKGLTNFDQALPQNFGLVFVSFQNETIDEGYAFRLTTALTLMMQRKKFSIPLADFKYNHFFESVFLPRVITEDGPAYDLQEVIRCLRLL